jgi:hypothetical protein
LLFCSMREPKAASFPAALLALIIAPLHACAAEPTNAAIHPGAALARTYCSACHPFAEPDLLSKKQWAHHVLPQMALWLGVEPVNFEGIQDGKIVQEANIYPPAPVVSDENWWKIWNYYVDTAPGRPLPPPEHKEPKPNLDQFRVRKANLHSGAPMTCLVKIDPVERLLYVADSFSGNLAIMDPAQNALKTVRLGSPAVSLTPIEPGLCVTLIGRMPPSEQAEGKVLLLKRDDPDTRLTLLENLRRPTDTQLSDFNGDGHQDLVVSSFGNRLGRFSWFQHLAPGKYDEHVLLARPGAVASVIHDVDRDDDQDILVLMAQGQEGLYLFRNSGKAQFRLEPVVEQHPSFGFAGFSLADFNGDGHIDIIAANGDNGDLPLPHKRYHGVRIYLNDGKSRWKESWFYPFEGAFKALPADFDGDGDLDIAAIAFYPDYEGGRPISFLYLKNTGDSSGQAARQKFSFEPYTIPEGELGRWMVMDANDLDGDGDTDIVLGSFVIGPTTVPVPSAVRERWRAEGVGVLILENRLR